MGRKPCCEKEGLRKGRWSQEEDERLFNYIRLHGLGSWHSLPKRAGLLRCGKSCRLRWVNYLRADIKRGNFSPHEDQIILNLRSSLGNRWSLIAAHLPGRTDNEIKNYWNTHLSKIQHIQKTVVEETSEAMPIANVPDGLADDNDKFCCNSTKHQLIDTKEDEMQCQTAGNKEGRSTVLVQEPDSPQASGAVAPNSDKAGWELLSLSPLSPIYIGLEVDTMFREDGGAHDTEMKEVVVDRARNELAEMEAQLWDETETETETEKMGSGLGHIDIAAEGALNLETLANWLLSDY